MPGIAENQTNPMGPLPARQLAPPACDPVMEAHKKDVDRTLLRQNLKLSVDERFQQFAHFMAAIEELREAGRKARPTG